MNFIKENKLKVGLIIVFLLLLGVEGYFLLNSNSSKKEESNNVEKKSIFDPNNEKYVMDVTTPYTQNPLEFVLVEKSDNAYYYKIQGLKNKEIENSINKRIEEKIEQLEKENRGKFEEYVVHNNITANFENIISISFSVEEYNDYKERLEELKNEYYQNGVYNSTESMNIDLNTGKDIYLNDVLLGDSNLREVLIREIAEFSFRSVGFVNYEKNSDYSQVEDGIYSVMNQYNKGNYTFGFTPETIYFQFKDVYFPHPKIFYENESHEKYNNCKRKQSWYDENEYYDICYDAYDTELGIAIDLYEISDDVIIYDKFKTKDNLYEQEATVSYRKFFNQSTTNIEQINEDIIEGESSLIDYSAYLFFIDDENLLKKVKQSVIKESAFLNKKDKYNVLKVIGDGAVLGDYYYIYYNVDSYALEKSNLEKYKKDIYLDKVVRVDTRYDENLDEEAEDMSYDFLKQYYNQKGYYFYIYDKNSNEMGVTEVLSDQYDFNEVIPKEWYSLGKYKNAAAMLKDAYIMITEDMEFPERLVIQNDIYNSRLVLKYKGRKKVIATDDEYDQLREIIFSGKEI